ncbi:MAG: ribonuclease III [Planctomycetota bacterium]|jgi:ribonuclease-3
MESDDLRIAEQMLGHQFSDPSLLEQALTHASLVDARLHSNERLEFLGDAVLGLVVCQYLFTEFDDLLEGEMTKIKSTVVSRQLCAEVAEGLGCAELIRLGKGMGDSRRLPGSVLAAVFEALIGALYVDAGLEVARRFILKKLEERIARAAQSGHQSNFKSVLQQTAQRMLDRLPQYIVLDEKGPDHAKCFEVCVEIGATRYRGCWGASKKQAEQAAALEALIELGVASRTESGEIRIRGVESATFEGDDPIALDGQATESIEIE